MTGKRRVLICDDESGVREKWKDDLEDLGIERVGFEVVHYADSGFLNDAIKELEKRRKEVRTGLLENSKGSAAELDSVDVLIVDQDLLELNEDVYFTGEDVAYIARCYSRCGFIMVLNNYEKAGFDLTLKGHVESYADLNLSGSHIANPNIWGMPGSRFKPWYWPIIPDFLERYERRIAHSQENFNAPIFTALGFTREDMDTLPREIAAYLIPRPEDGREETPGSETTFADFARYAPLGLRRKDKQLDDHQTARIAAARLSKWLERIVLPSQEILIDAPHLVLKFPSLFIGGSTESTELIATTARNAQHTGLDHEKIEPFRFSNDFWLNRPAWWWRRLRNYEGIDEVRDPWSVARPDVVFCEDVSEFLPREAAKDFVADVTSSAPQRWVVNVDSEKGKIYSKDLSDVTYLPPVQFSL